MLMVSTDFLTGETQRLQPSYRRLDLSVHSLLTSLLCGHSRVNPFLQVSLGSIQTRLVSHEKTEVVIHGLLISLQRLENKSAK